MLLSWLKQWALDKYQIGGGGDHEVHFGHSELEAFPGLPEKDMEVQSLGESAKLEGGIL